MDIIKRYEDHIDLLWGSEKYKSLYDAANKGTFASLGKWFIHINSDTKLATNYVFEKVPLTCEHKDYDIIYGNVINVIWIQNNQLYLEKPLSLEKLKYRMVFIHPYNFI